MVWVQNNTFRNVYLSGIRVEYPDSPLSNFWFNHNTFSTTGIGPSGGGYANIQTFGLLSVSLPLISNVHVSENTITTPGRVGIGLDRCDYCEVSGNRVVENGTVGEAIAFSGAFNQIVNNKISASGSSGILLYATSTSDMSHNVIQGNMAWNNSQGIGLVFDNPSSSISYEQVQDNKAFYLAGGGWSCSKLWPSDVLQYAGSECRVVRYLHDRHLCQQPDHQQRVRLQ